MCYRTFIEITNRYVYILQKSEKSKSMIYKEVYLDEIDFVLSHYYINYLPLLGDRGKVDINKS